MQKRRPTLHTLFASLTNEVAARIDALCDQFERRLGDARPVRIEALLGEIPPPARPVLLHLLLALEVEHLRKVGVTCDIGEYLRRFPDDQAIVRDVLGEACESTELIVSHVPDTWPTIPYYVLREQLGDGGMGTVYRALHILLKKEAAIKVLRPETLPHDLADGLFEEEIRNVGQLQHPHVVQALFAGVADGRRYLVLELIHGLDMARVVECCGPLPVAEACEAARQAALGLEHAHECGMVHRDIKPSNLLLGWTTRSGEEAEIKVADFGLAQLRGRRSLPQTTPDRRQVMGTFDYMAPEQFFDPQSVDIRADIYSLGCTLYALLLGAPPFVAGSKNPLQKMAAHRDESPRSLRLLRPDVPLALEEVIFAMMAKQPIDRFQTPRELAQSLLHFNEGHDLPQLLEMAEEHAPPAGRDAPPLTEEFPEPSPRT